MNEKIICFSLGLSAEEIDRGKASFHEMNSEAPPPEVFAITPTMLRAKVGDALLSVLENGHVDSAGERQGPENAAPPDSFRYRVMVVYAMEREQVIQVMRSFKAVLPDPRNIIFAVVTETALNWTFRDYIGHLGEEHESMTNRRPENNPDMKKM
jgi:predicted protein tyrosine phosphatase